MPSAAVVGGVSWNQLVDVPCLPLDGLRTVMASAERTALGGTGAGKATNLSRLGFRTRLHALLGDDDAGRSAAAALHEAGVELDTWASPTGTERHLNLMGPAGKRLSIFVNQPGTPVGAGTDHLVRFAEDADVVCISLADYTRPALAVLAARGVPLWVDLHDWDGQDPFHRDFATHGRYVFLSDERLDDPAGFAGSLVRGKALVVVTHGARGATAFLPGHEPLHVPAHGIEAPVDSNGAGDAFCAGVAFGRSRGWGWVESLRAGAYVAARSVSSTELADPRLSPEQVIASVGHPG